MTAPLVPIAIAFLAGVFAGGRSPPPVALTAALGVCAAALGWRWRVRPRAGAIAVGLLWMALGMLRMAVWSAHPAQRLAQRLTDEPQRVTVHGTVVDDPAELFGFYDEQAVACMLNVRHLRTPAGWPHHLSGFAESEPPLRGSPSASRQVVGWRAAAGRVQMTVEAPRAALRYGDEIVAEGAWVRVPAPGNPGAYDRRAALARRRVHGLLRVAPSDGLAGLGRSRSGLPLRGLFAWRSRLQQRIIQTYSAQHAGLLQSIVLGQRVALDERLKQAFIETGTVHLLVISGFNVGIIAWVIDRMLRVAGMPWRLRPWLAAAGIGAYGALTGWQPPVARAVIMAWIVFGAAAWDRVVSWPNTLAAAALAIVGMDPSQLADPSFQLSFGAVASLLVFTPRWQPAIEARLVWMPAAWLRRFLSASLSATLAVWAGLSPLLAWYFHFVSPISLVANLLLAPPLSLLVGLGTPLLLLGAGCTPLMAAAAVLLRWLLDGIVWCVVWLHRVPWGCVWIGHPSVLWLAAYGALVAISVARIKLDLSPARIAICWVAAAAVWVWSAVAVHAVASRWLRVDVVDVGHGDSILIRTPRHHAVLVDAGTQEAGRMRVLPFLRWEGIHRLDALMVTHTDEDHLGGAVPLLARLDVGRLLTNGVQGDTMSAHRLRALAAARRMPISTLAAGMQLNLGAGVSCAVLHPPRGGVPGSPLESNDNSLVLKVSKGAVSVLLTADIEEAGLPWLLETGAVHDVTVLKVPHHGSRLGRAGEAFFRRARPRVAIISVGRLHRLPSAETLTALRESGAAVYTTRDEGRVALRTDGRRLEMRTFRQADAPTWIEVGR
ncbi:MAG: DNA internalization-related competence protein ComEC/Rec2 [Candidatus Omnitrophica bacterium]|nr:DNA internalization-related competence protein ComEC/Rec2 [Candidatus Omnitrophota bacterium]